MVSGLKINFHKSKLATEQETRRLAGLLNCRIMKIPITYVGLPVGGNPRRISFWEPVLAKLRGRLSQWRQKNPFFWRPVNLDIECFIRLTPLLPFFLQDATRNYSQMQQDSDEFLMGRNGGSHQSGMIKWKKVCTPEDWVCWIVGFLTKPSLENGDGESLTSRQVGGFAS